MNEVPLQLVDNLLSTLNVGQILLAVLVLVTLGSLPLRSLKVIAVNVVVIGAILVLTPISVAGETILYRLVGVGLLVVGPMLYIAAER